MGSSSLFVHDNDKVCVVCATRCGHTSMRNYFGFSQVPLTDEDEWYKWIINTTSRRVLVLRNPLDRWKSAEVFTSAYFDDIKTKHPDVTQEYWLRVHRDPYLWTIPKYIDFEIIPFENIGDYIPFHPETARTDSANVHRTEVDMTPEMREELIRYRYFREHCRIITPEEWKELTP